MRRLLALSAILFALGLACLAQAAPPLHVPMVGFGSGSGGGGSASLTYGTTQTAFANSANAAITFTGQGVGVAAPNRYGVVASSLNTTSSLTVTIGGLTCTRVSQIINGSFYAEIWITNTPLTSGTTANVVFSGTHVSNIRIASSTYGVYGVSNPTTPSVYTSLTTPFSMAIVIPSGGIAIGSAVINGATSFTWSSFTKNIDNQVSPISYTAGSKSGSGSFTETITPGGGAGAATISAWSP